MPVVSATEAGPFIRDWITVAQQESESQAQSPLEERDLASVI